MQNTREDRERRANRGIDDAFGCGRHEISRSSGRRSNEEHERGDKGEGERVVAYDDELEIEASGAGEIASRYANAAPAVMAARKTRGSCSVPPVAPREMFAPSPYTRVKKTGPGGPTLNPKQSVAAMTATATSPTAYA